MIKMSKYLITLTPIDKFFFGGEIGFNRATAIKTDGKNESPEEKALREKNEKLAEFDAKNSSYIVKSNLFPQQTSLLGMLRYAFLSADEEAFENGEIKNTVKAAGIIGATSFNTDADAKMEFGKIKEIGPCFLQRKTEDYDWIDLHIAPMDYKYTVSFEEGDALLGNQKTRIPEISDYDPKDGITSYCIGDNGTELELKKLFIEDIRIGIDRNFDGTTKEGAFYKQVSYRLSNKYVYKIHNEKVEKEHQLRFAFYAELDKDIPEQIVELGGDSSRFKLTCNKQEEPEFQFPQSYLLQEKKGYEERLFLRSEALINQEAMHNCLFCISEIVPFRFLKSEVQKTTGYTKFSGENSLKRNNKKYNLYKRGSVFYFETLEAMERFTGSTLKKERFRQIGYNHFYPIKKQ